MNTSRPRVVNSVRALTAAAAQAPARLLAACLLLACASLTAAAQGSHDGGTPAESKGGTAAASTYAPDKLETVNLANGNLSMSLPLATVGGRGSASFAVTLSYNSKVWSSFHKQDPAVKNLSDGSVLYPALDHYYARYDDPGIPEPNRIDLSGGWSISLGPAIKIRAVDIDQITPASLCPQTHADDVCGYKYILTKAWLTLPDGSEVELRDNLTDGSPALTPKDGTGYHQHIDRDRGRVWHSADGSFVTFVLDPNQQMVNEGTPSGWVFLADGTRLRMDAGVCTKIIDPDGNYITIATANGVTTYTDELGRQTTVQFSNGVATVTARGYMGAADRTMIVNTGVIGSNLRSDFQSLPRPFTAGDYLRTQGQDDNPHTLPPPHTDLFLGSEDEQLDSAHVDERTAVTGVQLLDGRGLHFHYNQYGEVAEVVYPGGGVSQVDYQGFTSSLCAGLTPFNSSLDRRVTERRLLTDGTNPDATWLYTGSNSSTLATVEAHKGDRNGALLLHENHYFMEPVNAQHMQCTATRQNGTGYETFENAKENRVERQTGTDANGQPIYEVTVRNWEQRAAVAWPNDPGLTFNSYAAQHGAAEEDIPNDPRVTWEETTLEDQKTKRVEYTYDQFNNVTSTKEYDFRAQGAQPPGTLLRQTVRKYVGDVVQQGDTPSYNGYCYTNLTPLDPSCGAPPSDAAIDPTVIIHQRHLLLSEEVLDGAGNREEYSDSEYDNYAAGDGNHQTIAVNPGMTMYDGARFAAFDSSHQPRGNVTRERAWVGGNDSDQSSIYVTSFGRYDNAGNIISTKDPLGHESSVSYADDYGDGTSPGGTAVGQFGPTFARPTAVTNALGQVAKTQYDFTLGAATGLRDANNIITRTEYDQAGRPVRTTAALGLAEQAMTEVIYPTATSNVMMASRQLDVAQDGTGTIRWLASKTEMDGFDRPVLAASAEDGQKADVASFTIFTTTVYDALGRVKMRTNPYSSQAASTDGWTRTTYDVAGRVTQVASFTGGVSAPPPDDTTCTSAEGCTGSVTTTYAGEQTTVADQANKQRRSTVDGLGRLKSLDEMSEYPSTTVYATTSYGYDALGNLKTVSQGQQTRTFAYDGLSRLTSATNPEVCQQGQTQCAPMPVSYVYDAGGNLRVKTDARGVSSHYEYDALNRLTRRWYNGSSALTDTVNNTPALPQGVGASDEAKYFYDYQNSQTLPAGAPASFDPGMSVGRLVAVTYGGGAQGSYAGKYDAMGRPKASYQVTDTGTSDGVKTYSMGYSYNLAGGLTSETYPSNRKVLTEYDAAGRVAGVQNQATGLYYAGAAATDTANRVQYTAAGAPLKMKLGNGLWEHAIYNSRLQPTQIGLGTSGTDSSTLKLDYAYGVVVSDTLDTTKNNGNVQSQTITVPGAATPYVQSYTYDQVNRLWTAEEKIGSASNWKQVYTYDQYGNRNLTSETSYPDYTHYTQAQTDPTTHLPIDPVGNPVIDPATNRISVTATGQGNYQYDSAGNLLCDPGHQCVQGQSSPTPYYAYDAENKMKSAGGVPANGGAAYTYDGGGQRVKKVSGAVTTVFVYDAAGKLVAEYGGEQPQTTGTSYITQDHLGSTRIITGQNPTDVRGRYDYLPFGEELYIGRSNYAGNNDIKQKFTGYEKDDETGLNYAKARHQNYTLGRFQSPDPLLSSGKTEDPQSWNQYVYARNNPLFYTDPLGLFTWSPALGGNAKTEDLEAEKKRDEDLKKQTKDKEERKRLQKEIGRLEKIVERRKEFIAGMKEARTAANHLSGSERDRVNSVLDEYGDPGVDNGVTVALGDETQKNQGLTGIEDGRVIVAFRPDEFTSDTLFFTIAHEGRHIADAWTNIYGGADSEPHNVTAYQTEFTAYMYTFLAAKGAQYSKDITVGGVTIYQKGWTKIDVVALNKGLDVIYKGPTSQAGRSPANWDIRNQWR